MSNENVVIKTPLLSVRNMDVTFGKGRNAFKAVNDVSFDVYRGETFGLVGESGSGKTTIGRAIIRINKLSAGEVIYDGKRISGQIDHETDREVIKNIQMIFQYDLILSQCAGFICTKYVHRAKVLYRV